MDAFYAAVEQHDHPEWRGKPVIVGGPSRRGVVSTASYEARPCGVHSAMPMAVALRRCPQAIVAPPNFERYQEVSGQVMEVFGRFSPAVEPLSLDEAFLDLTGAERLFGPPEEIGRRIKREVREATDGLTVSVGISTTKFVAKVASDLHKPDGLTIVPGDRVAEFLAPLPVSRLWGVGEKTLPELERMGLRTIGDVARADRARLVRDLGALGEHIHRLALADDPRDVEPGRERKSLGSEMTLEEDVVGEAAIRPLLREAAARVARGLRDERLVAGGVRVKLKTHDFRLWTRQATLETPTDNAVELERAAFALLPEFDLRVAMRLVGLAAFRLADPESGQRPLFRDEAHERRRRLDRAVDALHDKFGGEVVKKPPMDTDKHR
ncbi:MAG: DNA polymerase IV [Deltaproteobacteria bacterium]|nr:DNA polymerase IV [Deltaproteobacteria bacterium]